MGLSRAEALALLNDPHTSAVSAEAIRRQLAPAVGKAEATGGGVGALRRSRVPGRKTKTEALYERRLELQREAGEVLGWDYECDRLKLDEPMGGAEGRRGRWKVSDFVVYLPGGRVVWDEIKGKFDDGKSIERFRWMCQRYPLRHFRLWRYAGGAWTLALESGGSRKEGEQ